MSMLIILFMLTYLTSIGLATMLGVVWLFSLLVELAQTMKKAMHKPSTV